MDGKSRAVPRPAGKLHSTDSAGDRGDPFARDDGFRHPKAGQEHMEMALTYFKAVPILSGQFCHENFFRQSRRHPA
jgi:hypothetical protein